MGSRQHLRAIKSGPPLAYQDDIRAYKREYAEALDSQDPLHHFRDEFIIPTKKDLKRPTLANEEGKAVYSDANVKLTSCLAFIVRVSGLTF